MTRDEAINMCIEVRHYLTSGNPIWDTDKVGEAIDMAIDVLKREPSEDLTSRAEAYTRIAELSRDLLNDDCINLGNAGEYLRIIRELPLADRSKGEWIDRKEEVDGFLFIGRRCSNCDWWENGGYNLPFCPNCGAKMDERSEK